jgi:biopolymer transport protein ExbD
MKLKKTDETDVSIDMSPMIDMVFLLLIFFIVASAMVDLDKPSVDLPEAKAAKVPEDISDRINLSVDVNEQIYIGSKPVTMDELKERIRIEMDTNPSLRIFIRSDKEVPYRANKKLMMACADVGAMDLIYAAFEE